MKKLTSLVLTVLFILGLSVAYSAQALSLKLTTDPGWGKMDHKSNSYYHALSLTIGQPAAKALADKDNRHASYVRFKKGKKDSVSSYYGWRETGYVWSDVEPNQWYTMQGQWVTDTWYFGKGWKRTYDQNTREFYQKYNSGVPWFKIEKNTYYPAE
jgi:hypothetical protein